MYFVVFTMAYTGFQFLSTYIVKNKIPYISCIILDVGDWEFYIYTLYKYIYIYIYLIYLSDSWLCTGPVSGSGSISYSLEEAYIPNPSEPWWVGLGGGGGQGHGGLNTILQPPCTKPGVAIIHRKLQGTNTMFFEELHSSYIT